MPRITFVEFDGTEHLVDVDAGLTVMEAARDNGIPGIEAECGGACACATCHVYIDRQWFEAAGEVGDVERALLEFAEGYGEESRLSCQINVTENMDGLIVRLPESQGF